MRGERERERERESHPPWLTPLYRNKGTPPISKRVVEMVGMEEVTLLLGRRGKGDDGRLVGAKGRREEG